MKSFKNSIWRTEKFSKRRNNGGYMKKVFVLILIAVVASLNAKSNLRFDDAENIPIKSRGKDKILNTKLIWEIDETEDFYGFSYVSQIEVYNNKLYILESEEWISVFTTSGKYIDQFGIKGNGPGEIQLMKDFDIYNDHIFSLDKSKYVVCKYDMNFNLIWEKKLPSEYLETLSPEEIEVNEKGILISGFSTNQSLSSIPTLFLLDEEMKILDKKFIYTPEKKMDAYGLLINTANRLTADNSGVYFAMMGGTDFLYKYDLNTNEIEYCIEKIGPGNGKYKIKNHSDGGTELMCYFNALDINCSENYLVSGENGGAFTKKQDKIKVPKSYKNNIALYRKNGTYLGSYFDDDLEYDYSGFTTGIQEEEESLYIYLYSPVSESLKKIKVKL